MLGLLFGFGGQQPRTRHIKSAPVILVRELESDTIANLIQIEFQLDLLV